MPQGGQSEQAGRARQPVGHATRQLDVTTRINSGIAMALGTVEALLVTRFLLLAFDADLSPAFADVVLDVSWPFVRPYAAAFDDGGWSRGVIEFNALLAMAVWAALAGVAVVLVVALAPRVRAMQARIERRRAIHG